MRHRALPKPACTRGTSSRATSRGARHDVTGARSARAKILDDAPHVRDLPLVRLVAEVFRDAVGVPPAHQFEPEKAARTVSRGIGAEMETVSLSPEGHRRKKRVHRREARSGQERATEAGKPITPESLEPRDQRVSASGISCRRMRTPQLMEQRLRSSENPACISAAALRA